MSSPDHLIVGASAVAARSAAAAAPLADTDRHSSDLLRNPVGATEADVAGRVQDFVAAGQSHEARDLFSDIVVRQQRRASRIAWHYLRDTAEADEAVQDAFVKAYTHIASFQRTLSFEVWFTRILINSCLDRQKARTRRTRWLLPASSVGQRDQLTLEHARSSSDRSPEDLLLAREWRGQLASAVRRLPGRQRLVFLLCHYADHSTRDVAEIVGLSESTVRVHLFRAVRKLRSAMEGQHHGI